MPCKTYIVDNLISGDACDEITKELNKIKGVSSCADLNSKTVTVFSLIYIDEDLIKSTIESLGYVVVK